MAKARNVPGIKPKRSLRENAYRVLSVRLDEFVGWRGALDDETLVEDLHAMRIAGKRLRYALEMFDLCLIEPKALLKELTAIQDDLGEIHDLDVLTDVLRARLAALDVTTEEEAILIMADETENSMERSRQVRRLLVTAARNPRRVGLVSLLADAIAQRRRRFAKFRQRYGGVRLDTFIADVQAAQQSHTRGADGATDGSERNDVEDQTDVRAAGPDA